MNNLTVAAQMIENSVSALDVAKARRLAKDAWFGCMKDPREGK